MRIPINSIFAEWEFYRRNDVIRVDKLRRSLWTHFGNFDDMPIRQAVKLQSFRSDKKEETLASHNFVLWVALTR